MLVFCMQVIKMVPVSLAHVFKCQIVSIFTSREARRRPVDPCQDQTTLNKTRVTTHTP